MTEDLIPSKTKLLTVCLHKDLIGKCSQYITYYANQLQPITNTSKKQLMVVPFPHERGSPVQPMLAELPHAVLEKKLWEALDIALPIKPLPPTRGLSKSFDGSSFTNSTARLAVVVQLGGYKISLVHTFEELQDQVNWSEFNLPHNFSALMADLQSRFGNHYGFIVAEPNLNLMDGRLGGLFAWVWYGERAFLPTAHEAPDELKGLTQYDVTGIILNEPVLDGLLWDSNEHRIDDRLLRFYVQENSADRDYSFVTDILNVTQQFLPDTPTKRERIHVPHIMHAARFDFRGTHNINANMVASIIEQPDTESESEEESESTREPNERLPQFKSIIPSCMTDNCVLF